MADIKDLLPQLAKEMAEDIEHFAHSFYLEDYLMEWLGIFDCIYDFLWDSPEALQEATEAIEEWLKDPKNPERLWKRLRDIRDKFLTEDKEEDKPDTVPQPYDSDELPF
jgi:uncharacterized protein with HEPN domain